MSQFAHGLTGQLFEIVPQSGVSHLMLQTSGQHRTGQPPGTASVRDDVGDRLPTHGQRDPLPRSYGIYHTGGLIAKLSHADLHVRHGSTFANRVGQVAGHLELATAASPSRQTAVVEICATDVRRCAYAGVMQTISQRHLRNDNAEVIRAVESGESFVVTKNGSPVAVVQPVSESNLTSGPPLSQAAVRRVSYVDWPRIRASVSSEQVLAELRDER